MMNDDLMYKDLYFIKRELRKNRIVCSLQKKFF